MRKSSEGGGVGVGQWEKGTQGEEWWLCRDSIWLLHLLSASTKLVHVSLSFMLLTVCLLMLVVFSECLTIRLDKCFQLSYSQVFVNVILVIGLFQYFVLISLFRITTVI